jgi:hypothetical protein
MLAQYARLAKQDEGCCQALEKIDIYDVVINKAYLLSLDGRYALFI